MTDLPCPVCGATEHDEVVLVRAMPVNVCQFTASRADALAVERGDLDIVVCRSCGHVFNRVFDPERIAYTQGYENAMNFSRHHRAYAEKVVASLIERYDLRDKTVIEIGCGSGDFLRQICTSGGNRGIGYDPSQPSQPAAPAGSGTVEIIGSPFDDTVPNAADAICSQHVLEHLPQPVDTLRRAREHLVPGGLGYFEVPNGDTIFHGLNIWDLNYEHVSYFSPASLHCALLEAGFATCRVETTFGRQYLDAEAIAGQRSPAAGPPMETLDPFSAFYARAMAAWRKQLSEWRKARQKVVLWGAGAKAVSLLNMLDVRAGEGVDYVVDISPRKAGRYVPGAGQLIVPPAFLREYRPDWIVIMNPEYRGEIETQIDKLGISSAIVDSAPPLS